MYDFSEDSVLLCLSNEYYDSEEYIQSYQEFEKRNYKKKIKSANEDQNEC